MTEPSAAIQDLERRRQAQSLAVFLLVAMMLALITIIVAYLPTNPISEQEKGLALRVEWAAFLLLGGAYWLSRSRHFVPAAVLTILIFLASAFYAVINEQSTPINLSTTTKIILE